jgi:sulfur-oxidizing protein SoxA
MKKSIFAVATLCVLGATAATAGKMATDTTPAQDLEAYRSYFMKRFPGVPLQEYANGVNAVSPANRANWEAIEEFPPYEPLIDEGKAMWDKPFANGKTYASCFPEGPGQRKNYPYWDAKRKMVVTMELAVNECRSANGEKPLKWSKGPITRVTAYMAYKSRGQVTDVKVPTNDPGAMGAYNAGKTFFFARRGQLNFSCASCHVESSGQHIRTNVVSPALGHTTGFPVYRSKWGDMGTLHRRFKGCNKQVRAKPFKAQSKEYRDLEYFMTHMSNGIKYNGPSNRE